MMAANLNFNFILHLIRATMYLIIGVIVIFIDFPIFKNSTMRIILGVLFILYAAYRFYQIIQQRKRKTIDQEE